jgi:L-lactate dehydrogenase complex protein LldE
MPEKVQLFITCLAEQFYPNVLEKMVEILERLGIEVQFPGNQTCCGQPFYNSGFRSETRKMAVNWLKAFSRSEAPIVSPSGSCVEMVKTNYLELFEPGSPDYILAEEVGGRTFEFSEFLVRELNVLDVGARYPHKVTYHASCHLLRGLGLRQEAKQLLGAVRDLELVPLTGEETCCGFGGVFSVIYPEVSRSMMEAKIKNILATGAEAVVACDAGCLMNLGGGLKKAGSRVKALHLIEVLGSNGSER